MNTHHPFTLGPRLNLRAGELKTASIGALVRAAVTKDDFALGPYREWSDEIERQCGGRFSGQTLAVPGDLLRRDLTVAGPSGGAAYLVGTQNLSFADVMSNASILSSLPVQRHQSLRADQTITRLVTKASTKWLSDEGTPAEVSNPVVGQVSLTPKVVVALVNVTRQLVVQGGELLDRVLTLSLAGALAEAVDAAAIAGAGSAGEPQGLQTAPAADVRVGTSFSTVDASEMLLNVEGWAPGGEAWVAGTTAAKLLRQRARVSGGENPLLTDAGTMLGKPVLVSRSAPDSSLLIAPWPTVHYAEWGAVELASDPYTMAAQGLVQVRCLLRLDLAVEDGGKVAVASTVT